MPNRFEKITHYLAVPLRGAARERTVKCQYFRKEGKEWIAVAPNDLRSYHKDVVSVSQPPYEEAVKVVPDADPCLHLFAGVAKTRNADHAMPNLMPVNDGAIIVAIYPKSSRSLILIFERRISETEFGELVATTDPDVRNGEDGMDCGHDPDDIPC
jgi:hypothetical protein